MKSDSKTAKADPPTQAESTQQAGADTRPIVVQTIDLSRRYKKGREVVDALDGVNITIRRGEILGVIGPSGSGKTTFLNMVGGLDKPTRGKVLVDGVDLATMNESKLADYRLKKIGFVFQFYNLLSTLNAVENVELPMDFAKVEEIERTNRSRELLKTVGLAARISHMPEEMSGGEQQRVAVARALSNVPAVILGDEPTGDLDSKSAKSLMDLIWSLRKEKKVTFVLVTHDPLVVARCDRVISFRDGKITREIVPAKEKQLAGGDRSVMDQLL